ncbi:hypothetical protein R1flu_015471 [Riccia fluitans]|uniref:Uncharacterized protein n=1 Tax=Riccia fluitans TaxID=41844 RepID=A0ABD1YJD5_9MARC
MLHSADRHLRSRVDVHECRWNRMFNSGLMTDLVEDCEIDRKRKKGGRPSDTLMVGPPSMMLLLAAAGPDREGETKGKGNTVGPGGEA